MFFLAFSYSSMEYPGQTNNYIFPEVHSLWWIVSSQIYSRQYHLKIKIGNRGIRNARLWSNKRESWNSTYLDWEKLEGFFARLHYVKVITECRIVPEFASLMRSSSSVTSKQSNPITVDITQIVSGAQGFHAS